MERSGKNYGGLRPHIPFRLRPKGGCVDVDQTKITFSFLFFFLFPSLLLLRQTLFIFPGGGPVEPGFSQNSGLRRCKQKTVVWGPPGNTFYLFLKKPGSLWRDPDLGESAMLHARVFACAWKNPNLKRFEMHFYSQNYCEQKNMSKIS